MHTIDFSTWPRRKRMKTLSGWGSGSADARWSNYQQSDLYRPLISVKFGVYYLRRYGLDSLDGDMYAAWAAYNGGPGNAQRWKENSNGDTDLFVENSSLGETRLYIDRLR